MSKSRGKKFETEIARMLKAHAVVAYVHHAYDLPPSARTRFAPSNPIDFLCFWQGGHGLTVECKAVQGKSLPFSRFVSNRERANGELYGRQWRALEKCARAGVDTFVLVNHYGWPGRDGTRGRAWAVPFCVLVDFREATTRKSWPVGLFETCRELHKIAESWEWLEIG